MKKLQCIVLIVMCFVIFMSGCTREIKPKDLIIKVDKNSLVKVSEADILSYFNKNRDSFKTVIEYMLNSEKVFGTRPVVINKVNGLDKIQDGTIKKIADTLIQEETVKTIYSENDIHIKYARFYIDSEYGVYEQGIRYISDKSVIDNDKTEYNYVKEHKDLGDGWFYYIYYYDKIKDEDIFRKKAWDTLSEQDKKSISYDWSKAIVTLKDWDSVGTKTGKVKDQQFVVSVCFNTEADGLLGPIVLYLDPASKEILGLEPRM